MWGLCFGITMQKLGDKTYELGFEDNDRRVKYRNAMVDLVRFLNSNFVFGAETKPDSGPVNVNPGCNPFA